VINLMEALQQSVARLGAAADQPLANGKPAGKRATSARGRVSQARRRKIS
jgi:hypothetical protein